MTLPEPPWHCPICDAVLEHPRVVAAGCMGQEIALGECPMHRTLPPKEAMGRG